MQHVSQFVATKTERKIVQDNIPCHRQTFQRRVNIAELRIWLESLLSDRVTDWVIGIINPKSGSLEDLLGKIKKIII